ncbi:HNH endonuclease [Staphylococcus cohnii]|uniref:HNH endonuclease n=1 Tax=Staphylococcus cohnii TaxID=29382 RepID=UPI003D7DC1FE
MSKPKWNAQKKYEIKQKLTNGVWKCQMCHKEFIGPSSLEIEHKLPLSRGGGNELGNLTVLCKSCNSKRKNRMGDEHLKIIIKNIEKSYQKLDVELLRYEKELGLLDYEDVFETLNNLENITTDFHNTLVSEVIDHQ